MDDSQFESLADATLARVQKAVEAAPGGSLDAEIVSGILTIETESGDKFLLNKHGPNHQIWLSSPVSGAWHFAWSEDDQGWVSTRGGERFDALLGRELSKAAGEAIDLA
jgi:frataxin